MNQSGVFCKMFSRHWQSYAMSVLSFSILVPDHDYLVFVFEISTNMEGESRVLGGEIWIATSLVETALANVPEYPDRLRAFKQAALADWKTSRIPLAEAVHNDLYICLLTLFSVLWFMLLFLSLTYWFIGMSLSDPECGQRVESFCLLPNTFMLKNDSRNSFSISSRTISLNFVFYSLDANIQDNRENRIKLFPPPR